MKVFIKNGEVHDFATSLDYQGELLYDIKDLEVQAILNPASKIEAAERGWRDLELARADIELLKVQDGDGTGLASDWRAYRVALRNYPQQEGFPNCERPKFNNSDKE